MMRSCKCFPRASKIATLTYDRTNSLEHYTVRKEVDVNEQAILFNITIRHKLKERCFDCCSTFDSYSRIFRDEHTAYSKISGTAP